jgi:hypothetical protein
LLGSDFPEDASEVRRFAASLHEVSWDKW